MFATVLVAGAIVRPSSAAVSTSHLAPGGPSAKPDRGYTFRTLDDPANTAYNVLTGINNAGVISGYYGAGLASNPSQGYTLAPPYGASNYVPEAFPTSSQTQVLAINNLGNPLGRYADTDGNWYGFVDWYETYTHLDQQTQGLNGDGWTVWTKVRAGEYFQVFLRNVRTGKREQVTGGYGGGELVLGTALNDRNDVVGWHASHVLTGVYGWAHIGGHFYDFTVGNGSGSDATTPSGINNKDEIVGTYSDYPYNQTHGFVLTGVRKNQRYKTVDDPNGAGTTVINAVNDDGQLVGTYVDASGYTHGFLATPR